MFTSESTKTAELRVSGLCSEVTLTKFVFINSTRALHPNAVGELRVSHFDNITFFLAQFPEVHRCNSCASGCCPASLCGLFLESYCEGSGSIDVLVCSHVIVPVLGVVPHRLEVAVTIDVFVFYGLGSPSLSFIINQKSEVVIDLGFFRAGASSVLSSMNFQFKCTSCHVLLRLRIGLNSDDRGDKMFSFYWQESVRVAVHHPEDVHLERKSEHELNDERDPPVVTFSTYASTTKEALIKSPACKDAIKNAKGDTHEVHDSKAVADDPTGIPLIFRETGADIVFIHVPASVMNPAENRSN